MGLPLFTPAPVNREGKVLGVVNNRVIAHHVGLGGKLAHKVPYRLMATYSLNAGRYDQSLSLFRSRPQQLSMALEVSSPKLFRNFSLQLSLGLYGDVGELYVNNFGVMMRLSCSGGWRKGQ